MKPLERLKYILWIAALLSLIEPAGAQVTLGAGYTGFFYLGKGLDRSAAKGLAVNAGIDLNSKSELMLEAAFYSPTSFTFSEPNALPMVPKGTSSTEKFNTSLVSLLYQVDIFGENGWNALYAAAGPGVAFYKADITRAGLEGQNYSQKFQDVVFDFRLGAQLPIGPLMFFTEGGLQPVLVSTFRKNDNYIPGRSTMFNGLVGLRFRICD